MTLNVPPIIAQAYPCDKFLVYNERTDILHIPREADLQAQLMLAPLTWRQLFILLIGRLALNTAFRVVYPLLAFLATGLRVDLATASLLITAQVAATLISPLGGSLADTYGERTTMLGGLMLFCAGAVVCAIAHDFVPFMLGYGLIGLATALYHPSAQAYASARTPYSQRGRVLGILELSWAFAALAGVTSLSWLIGGGASWAPAFWALFVTGLVVLLGTWLALPAVPHIRQARLADEGQPSGGLLAQPSVIAAMLCLFCTLLAAELIFVVYAGWIEADFGATTEQLALVFGLLGFAELGGSSGSTLLVDRIGKRRTVLIAFTVVALFQGLLPISSGNWALFLVLFLLFDLWFEFAIVSIFPLVSGIVPAARGTMLSLSVAAIGLGRVVGSLAGPLLWERFGFVANGLLAAGMTALGVIVCLLFVHEGEA
jgi:predicted MFS family arabinose efflux permease